MARGRKAWEQHVLGLTSPAAGRRTAGSGVDRLPPAGEGIARRRALALDLATSCGWAVGCGKVERSGMAPFDAGLADKLPTTVRHAAMFLTASDWLVGMLVTYRVEVLVVEDSTANGLEGWAAWVIGGLRGVVLAEARRRRLEAFTVNNATWKSFARRLGWRPELKSDEEDARWMLAYWMHLVEPSLRPSRG